MTSSLFAILCFAATPWFSPNVRVHHERPRHGSFDPAIAVGPGAPSSQPIYVVYEDDSMAGFVPIDGSLMFQKSTDAGATWLAEDKLVRYIGHTNLSPDVTTDVDGNIYIVYSGRDSASWGHYCCVRSTDGGVTWSEPVQVDDNEARFQLQWTRVATDSAGNLFCVWPCSRDGRNNIWSSISTDRGTTWGASVRVCDDTTSGFYGFADVDVFVEPSTNQYLVTAVNRRHTSPLPVEIGAYLYRSADGGRTFQSEPRLDTFSYLVAKPHVVADRDHIICDYTGNPGDNDGLCLTESRTFYAGQDTWGSIAAMNDTVLSTYYNGSKLAISADGIVHTALMCRGRSYWMGYAYSADHGATWCGPTRVDDGVVSTQYPDIGVDSEGHAYVIWCDLRSGLNEIWFSTNRPLAVAEQPMQQSIIAQPSATVVRNVLFLAERPSSSASTCSLLDISGRDVLDLKPGANDVRSLAPGVYFVREAQAQAVRKIVVTR